MQTALWKDKQATGEKIQRLQIKIPREHVGLVGTAERRCYSGKKINRTKPNTKSTLALRLWWEKGYKIHYFWGSPRAHRTEMGAKPLRRDGAASSFYAPVSSEAPATLLKTLRTNQVCYWFKYQLCSLISCVFFLSRMHFVIDCTASKITIIIWHIISMCGVNSVCRWGGQEARGSRMKCINLKCRNLRL